MLSRFASRVTSSPEGTHCSAGVYIPTVTLEIMKRKCPRPINLKGMAIGNGAAHSPPQFLLPRACLQSLGAACAGCTGTDAGPCSPGRAVYTLEQLYLQSMVSQRTHAAIEVACADSLAYTQANPECQRLLLLAGEEAGNYNNCATPRRPTVGPSPWL